MSEFLQGYSAYDIKSLDQVLEEGYCLQKISPALEFSLELICKLHLFTSSNFRNSKFGTHKD